MDLRNINQLGFALFGQLLEGKADFRILQTEGILSAFGRENLEKLFQLPYGLDINPDKEYLSFIKLSAQSGKYGPAEHYILVTGYKFAGIDINKRKNYYGGCAAYKYEGYVIDSSELLSYLTMIMDCSKSLLTENRPLPLKLQEFKGINKEISFGGLSQQNQYVITSTQLNDKVKKEFIDFNLNNGIKLAPMHRFILALGSTKIQGTNSLEIKTIECGFEKAVSGEADLIRDNEIKFKEAGKRENNKIMTENRNDARIEEAINEHLKPVYEKLDSIEKNLSNAPSGKGFLNSVKGIDKIYLSLIIILLIALFFVLKEVVAINIITRPAEPQVNSKTVQDIERLVSHRIDSLNHVKMEQSVTYVAAKGDNLSAIAEKFKVAPDMIINKNSQVKAGDTLIIRK